MLCLSDLRNKDEYNPVCSTLFTDAGSTYTENFSLGNPDVGTVSGTVTIAGGSNEQHVTLSFRSQCGLIQEVEVKLKK